MDPTHSLEMPNCSAIDLDEIRPSSKISSWICGVVTVLGRAGRGTSLVEKSPRLNWVTQFLTVTYDGACSPNVSVRMAWISFGALPCRKQACFWNRSRRLTCFLSAFVTRKDLQFGTWSDPSFQRHYRFRPKDLKTPPRTRGHCIIFFLWPNSPNRAWASSFLKFLDHTTLDTRTAGRTTSVSK